MADRLTDEEFDQLRSLLKRYCEAELDQFTLWQVATD
jgi:hypothetical protein